VTAAAQVGRYAFWVKGNDIRTSTLGRFGRNFAVSAISAAVLGIAAPVYAQDDEAESDPPFTVTGSVTLASDYRFRGVSQSDEEIAVQGGLTIAHESGFYIGTWGSNLSGWGTFGGANLELDLYAGYTTDIGDATVDVGVTWYTYPGGADESDFWEGYAKLSGTTGPLKLTGSVFYAPEQQALGNFSNTPFSRGQKEDNIYLAGDAAFGVPGTPVTINAHIGYSDGNPGLGPNGTSVAPTGEYWDWSLGAAVNVYGPLTLSVAYVDTDISAAESAFLQPNFSRGNDGTGQIADATVVVALTAAF